MEMTKLKEKIADWADGTVPGIATSVLTGTLYGFFKGILAPLRIPTYFRQTAESLGRGLIPGPDKFVWHKISEVVSGYPFAFMLIYKTTPDIVDYVNNSMESGDYLPLAMGIGANVLSGSYEVVKSYRKQHHRI